MNVAGFLMKPVVKTAAMAASGMLYLATIAAAYGGHINPHTFALPSTLVLVFPWLALASFLTALAWLLARRIFMAASGALVFLVTWGSVTQAALPMGHGKSAKDEEHTFSLLTYNICNGTEMGSPQTQENRQMQYVLDSGADIVCLQEFSHLTEKGLPNISVSMLDFLKKAYPYRIEDPEQCMGLLSKYPATKVDISHFGFLGRNLAGVYQIDLPGITLTVINVHLSSYLLDAEEREIVEEMKSVEGMKESLEEIRQGGIRAKLSASFRARAVNAENMRRLVEHFSGPLVICGDFNDVPASWAYRVIKGDDLKDAYNQTRFLPTHTFNDHLFYFHIDQILYRPADSLRALSTTRGSLDASDHYPVMTVFAYK